MPISSATAIAVMPRTDAISIFSPKMQSIGGE
jgi:hypothetical protein